MGGEWQLDLSDLFLVRVFSRKKLCPILCPPCDSDQWTVARRPSKETRKILQVLFDAETAVAQVC
jgi:hypothetical protein